jgi:5'-3' exonuclease
VIDYKELSEETKKNIIEMATKKKDIIILDVSYHLYRYFFVHGDLSVSRGGEIVQTGHIYGFLNMICGLRRTFDNPAILMVIDGHDDERSEINPEYKTGRSDKFNVHKDTWKVVDMCSLLDGIYFTYDSKYEADDGIYVTARTIDRLLVKNNIEKDIHIFATDKDLFQTINPRIKVLKALGKGTGKKKLLDADIMTEERIIDEYGVMPDDLPIYRALVGDKSDHLPGYSRIPKKLAAKVARAGSVTEDGLDIDDVEFSADATNSDKKWVEKIREEYELFHNNYRIMKAKEFVFEIKKPDSVGKASTWIEYFELNKFRKEVEIFNRNR